MKKSYIDYGYCEYWQIDGLPIAPFAMLSPFAINEHSDMIGDLFLPLNPCRSEWLEHFAEIYPDFEQGQESAFKIAYPISSFHDTLSCTLNCEYKKIPNDLKNTVLDHADATFYYLD